MEGWLGTTFLNKDNIDETSFNHVKFIGLYFSASWCRPCKLFTLQLTRFYNQINQSEKQFEVIFVSGDQDEPSFLKYYQKMPWLAIPFSDERRIYSLQHLFRPRGIPALYILNNKGKTISNNGTQDIMMYGMQAFEKWSEKDIQPKCYDIFFV